jgi:signal transduction histidine kinase
VEPTQEGINPDGPEGKHTERDARRLKLVYCNGQQHQFPHDSEQKRARRDRLVRVGNLAGVFAHEVADPLSALSASLQFALKDLGRMTLDRLPRKDLDIPIIQKTIQGALREVERLVALLGEFRSAVPAQPFDLEPDDLERLIREILALNSLICKGVGSTVTADQANGGAAFTIRLPTLT